MVHKLLKEKISHVKIYLVEIFFKGYLVEMYNIYY